jgi:8-oxo-dGTP diphosphatase
LQEDFRHEDRIWVARATERKVALLLAVPGEEPALQLPAVRFAHGGARARRYLIGGPRWRRVVDPVPVPVVVAILLNRHRVFMLKRARTRSLPNQWEFPGGKLEIGESPESGLRRELREELGFAVGRLVLFGAYSHVYDLPEGAVHYVLLAYRANARGGTWSRSGRWMDARALGNVRVVEGSRPIVSDLVEARLVRSNGRRTKRREVIAPRKS